MDKLTTAVRKARRVGALNKIAGIKAIRTAYPEPGLLEAKNFFELITGSWSHVAAVNMHALWCPEHWGDRLECRCSTDIVWCEQCDKPLAGYTFEQRKEHYNECVGEARGAKAGSTITSGALMTAVETIRKIDAEKTAGEKRAQAPAFTPGIFPNQETANYWAAEFKRDPFNWHSRLLSAAGVQ